MTLFKDKNFIKFLKSTFAQVKWQIISYFILTVITASMIPLDGLVTKYFINYIINEKITHDIAIMLAIGFYFWWELSNILYRLFDYVCMIMYPKIKANIINDLSGYLLDHSHKYFQENFSGSVVNKVSEVSKSTGKIIGIFLWGICKKIINLVVSIIILYQVHPKFALIMFLYASVFVIINIVFLKPLEKKSRQFAEARSKTFGGLVDVISNIMNVRYFANKKYELNYIGQITSRVRNSEYEFRKYELKTNYFKSVTNNIMIGTVVYYITVLYSQNLLTYGDFYLIFMVCINISHESWDFLEEVAEFIEEQGTIRQGLNTLLIKHNITDKPNAELLAVTSGNIKFENVNFKYLKDQYLLHNLSIDIKGGTKVGLVGYSGAGKTTFVNLIIRLYDLEEGSILIDGQDIKDVTQESLRKNISFIPQDPVLFHRSLIENIRYGKPEATDEEVVEAAKLANAHEFILQTEKGYESLVGERGIKLSGGQKQRIAIARAILKNAPILVLDEATSSLDSVTEKEIQESLEVLMQNKTCLIIAHRLSTLTKVDRILVFNQGEIIQDGSHKKLIEQEGLYNDLWNFQLSSKV